MPELSLEERLQPSLLDRLTDNEPGSVKESTAQRVIDMRRLRELVLRDLAWLLNCDNAESAADWSEYPHVRKSVVNFGISGLTGASLARTSLAILERGIRESIRTFEPRILPDSVQVFAQASESAMNNRALSLKIEGEMWAQPVPVRLLVRTEFDLDLGVAKIVTEGG